MVNISKYTIHGSYGVGVLETTLEYAFLEQTWAYHNLQIEAVTKTWTRPVLSRACPIRNVQKDKAKELSKW